MDKTLQMIADQFDRVALGDLRSRPGAKWQCPPPDVLPAWVADMDFPVAPAITDRLRQVLGQGDLGYPNWPAGATPVRCAFAARMADRYRWHPDPDHVREFANVTQAVQVILYLVTEPGDAVAVHTPAFRPFMAGIAAMRRRLVPIPMHDIGAGWAFDAQRFAAEVAATGCRVLLLVNPHNPTGRVFTRAELLVLADVAARHDLLVISDEIHADLTYAPGVHTPFASLDAETAARTVTITSASKAFNLAGLRAAVCHIGAAPVRARLDGQPAELFGSANLFGVQATLAAWGGADDWLDATIDYLDANRRLVGEVLGAEAPHVRLHLPEATYLAWLDCRALHWGDDPAAVFRQLARVQLSSGPDFNPGGAGFVRLNFACPRPLLRDVLERMVAAAAGTGPC